MRENTINHKGKYQENLSNDETERKVFITDKNSPRDPAAFRLWLTKDK